MTTPARLLQVAITTGEPAGVGPELTAAALAAALLPAPGVIAGSAAAVSATGAAAAAPAPAPATATATATATAAAAAAGAVPRWPGVFFTVLCDAALFATRAAAAGLDAERLAALLGCGQVRVAHHPLAVPCVAGQLDAGNGRYVLGLLDAAIDGALQRGAHATGGYDAIVTAPLQKSTINDAGVPFTGHTEYLAARTGSERVVMMLTGAGAHPLRVALATTHLALKDVPAALTIDGLLQVLRIIDADLRRDFGIAAPRILVTGLNPHAGENGYLGREEIDTIAPALAQAQAAGIDARGPYPADTLFQPRYLREADCVLAMFHDQGLPVLKYATFGAGTNVTLGLPIIRTSVDHGTALDLAGTGRAEAGSLSAAIDTAVAMAQHR